MPASDKSGYDLLPLPNGTEYSRLSPRSLSYSHIKVLLALTLSIAFFFSTFSPSARLHQSAIPDPQHSNEKIDSASAQETLTSGIAGPDIMNHPVAHSCKATITLDEDGQRWESPSAALPLSAPLSTRIQAWRQAPLADASIWTAFNQRTCGGEDVVMNWNERHRDANLENWTHMNASFIEKTREVLIATLEEEERAGRLEVPEEVKGRRGIVFTGGNSDTFERCIVSLRMIRSYGNEMPAEIWHFPGETPTSAQVFEYEKYNAKAMEVKGLQKHESSGRAKSFHIKAAAVLQSSFEEVLYLDSDSIPAKDPASLFDSSGYKEYGALFWSDYWKDSADNAIWSLLGVQCRDEWTFESGQFLINKRYHLDVIHLWSYTMSHFTDYFVFSDGDKDLVRYSFLALRKRWATPARPLAAASWLKRETLRTNEWCGHTMMQYDHEGKPAFVHANLVKRILGTFARGETWGITRQLVLPPIDANITTFPLSCDHLANANSQGVAILPAPAQIRQRAAVERNIHTIFHDGHRGPAYVLCVKSDYRSSKKGSEEDQDTCGAEEVEVDGEGIGGMEEVLWEDDEILKDFEERYFGFLGKPNGSGF